MMKKTHSKRPGMTLIEIIFAFAIITTVLTLAYGSALTAWRSAAGANQRTQAQYLAQQGIESIRAAREQTGFDWQDFINSMPAGSGGFHMVLRQNSGAESASTFVCPPATAPCSFEVEDGPVPLSAIGSNLDPALATNSDATEYTLEILPESYYVRGNAVEQSGSPRNVSNVTAVVFTARVTWRSTSGVADSSLNASTIISETE